MAHRRKPPRIHRRHRLQKRHVDYVGRFFQFTRLTWFTAGILSVLIIAFLVGLGVGSNADSPPIRSVHAPDRWLVSSIGLASALYVPGSWSNRVAHWTTLEYHYDATSHDPGNGRILQTDIWEEMGADGRPESYHEAYTFADTGAVYQQFYLTRSMLFTELGAAYYSTVAHDFNAPSWCIIRSQSSFAAIALRVPLFVNTATLKRFARRGATGAPSKSQPGTPDLLGAHALLHYGRATIIQQWQAVGADHLLEVDPLSGRLIVDDVATLSPQGGVSQETWIVQGPVTVYATSSVPASLYTIPAKETCAS